MRYAIIDTSNNKIINAVEYDDAPSNPPPGFSDGIIAVQHDVAGPDWSYSNGTFTAPSVSTAAPPVPWTVVSPRQARLALFQAGLLDQVEATVKASGGAVQIEWDYASQIERHDTLVSSIGSALNLTSDQIDALFKTAITL